MSDFPTIQSERKKIFESFRSNESLENTTCSLQRENREFLQTKSVSNYNSEKTEITNFLFQPGFSTASEITDLSGRGVGLNVVESQIKALDGKISIRSKLKEGTTFVLKLPLNLTTARLLLCESQKNIYGILATEIAKNL